MNIAILLSGQIRSYHNTLKNLNFLTENLKNYNIYFFYVTNFEENIDFNRIKSDFNFSILDVESYNEHTIQFINGGKDFFEFCENYKNDEVNYQIYGEHSRCHKTWYNHPILCQKLYKGVSLIESFQIKNNIKFDLIMRTRWDVMFRTNFTEQDIINASKSDDLFVYQHLYEMFVNSEIGKNNSDQLEYHKYIDKWVDELFFYGNFNTMKKFSHIYFEYVHVAKKYNIWTTHEIFKKYIMDNNIDIRMPSVKISIVRDSHVWHMFDYLWQ